MAEDRNIVLVGFDIEAGKIVKYHYAKVEITKSDDRVENVRLVKVED